MVTREQTWSQRVRRAIRRQLLPLALSFFALAAGSWYFFANDDAPFGRPVLRVMAYSSFVSSWGAGPDIARRFEDETGVRVRFHDAGDSGLMFEKLKLFPADVVVGPDRLSLPEARRQIQWRNLSDPEFESPWKEADFVAFDWAPLTFIYRDDETRQPPRSLKDLLDTRFRGQIALQDPRTSSPGQQFLFWVLDVFGIEGGFEFLAKLKPNVQSVSGGWSTAYGLFTGGQAKLVFSYLTSPVFHWMEKDDRRYQAAVFDEGHPAQVEYAGVPMGCSRCDVAEQFVRFLLRPDIQKVLMTKNIMLPIRSEAREGTPFADPRAAPTVRIREMKSNRELLDRRAELFERFRKLEL